MNAPPLQPSSDSPPALVDDVISEILLRIPPDDPATILRAFLVCKLWSRAFTHPNFLRRLHELHRTPPVLGLLHNVRDERVPEFIPATASAFSLPIPDRRSWRALGCRHGRALFYSAVTRDLIVWEPITGNWRPVPVPAYFKLGGANAAVVCAADGCDHRDCHGGPFRVFLVRTTEEPQRVASACVYSSETGCWGEPTTADRDLDIYYGPSALVGKSLYFMCSRGYILAYDLAGRGLTVIDPPEAYPGCGRILLMPADGGGLGVAGIQYSSLYLWSRQSSDAGWVQSRVIHLNNLLPIAARSEIEPEVVGFSEETNAIFLGTDAGVFEVQLQTCRVRKVCQWDDDFYSLIPIVGFYIPGHARARLPPP